MDEPEDAGVDHNVPVDLVELHEVLEWNAATQTDTADPGDEDE